MEAAVGDRGRVRIKECRAVASWHWRVVNETVCGICQHPYDGACPACTFPGEDCPLLWGACKHAFHMHCIIKWLDQQQQQQDEGAPLYCPMCRQEWRDVNSSEAGPAEGGEASSP